MLLELERIKDRLLVQKWVLMNNLRTSTTMKFVSFLVVMPRVLSDRVLNFIFPYNTCKYEEEVRSIVSSEGIWANNYLAKRIMNGTYPSYVENANISTISNAGEAIKVEAIIGIKATSGTWSSLVADIKKNATGQTAYSLVQVSSQELPRLTLVRGLMRAVPWEHIDPPDPWDILGAISDIVETITKVLQEVYHAIINAITAAMNAVASILSSIASAIVAGVRMLVAGIMAMVNFVISFFKDLALLLWEFGQWFIGILKNFADKIAHALKFILKAIAEIVGYFFRIIVNGVGVLLGYLAVYRGGDSDNNFVVNVSFGFLHIAFGLYVEYLDPDLGIEIPFLIASFNVSMFVDSFPVMSFIFMLKLSSLLLGTEIIFDAEASLFNLTHGTSTTPKVPRIIVSLMGNREFIVSLVSTAVSQFLAEAGIIGGIEAATVIAGLSSGWNLLAGAIVYLASFGAWYVSYEYSLPPADKYFESLGASIACTMALIYGLFQLIDTFKSLWGAFKMNRKLLTLKDYLDKNWKKLREYENSWKTAAGAIFATSIASIVLTIYLASTNYSWIPTIIDIIFYVFEKIAGRVFGLNIFLWKFLASVDDFKSLLEMITIQYGKRASIFGLVACGSALIAHIVYLVIVFTRLGEAWNKYVSSFS